MNLTPSDLAQLSKQLKTEIDQWCVLTWNDGPRSHLGASQIGHSCSRYLWYCFRWIAYTIHTGRMYRLFQRGHFEEERFIRYLMGIGYDVTVFDENNLHEEDKGKRQIRISACKGHFGGSIDGIAERNSQRFLTEFKTAGVGKKGDKFSKLVKEGVKVNKPQHWAQMCMYGYKLNLTHAIYMAVNKNDDDLHVEVVELDHKLGADLERKSEMIIFSQEPPAGVSCSRSYYECNYCDAVELCYGNQEPLKNCRSCKHAFPVDNAEWNCEVYGIIPKDAIPIHQPCWESII